ncbi:MFS transporter [soil metagenome]
MERTGDSLLRNSHFVKLWIGQAISFVGDAISMVALIVLIVQITGSASAVGALLFARFIPMLASPLVGVFADRFDRRTILVASDLVRALLVAGVVLVRDPLIIYVLVFLMGTARLFFNPTIRAAFPSVVGGGDLTRANALISATFSVSIAVGPAIGGLLVATVGVNAAFVLDAATYVVSSIFLASIPLPRPQREEETSYVQDLWAGLHYLAGARVPLAIVLGAFLLVLTINATVPAEIFLAKDTFGAGNAGYGLLVSLWGGGMVLGSALIAMLGDRTNLMLFFFLGVFISAIGLVGTGLAPSFLIALIALTAAGIANGTDNVTTDTILQKRVPDALLGRVFAARYLTYSTGELMAYGGGGLLVDAIGPRSTYLFTGIGTLVVGLIVLSFIATASPDKSPH